VRVGNRTAEVGRSGAKLLEQATEKSDIVVEAEVVPVVLIGKAFK